LTLGTQVGQVTGQAQVVVDEGSAPVAAEFVNTAVSTNANVISMVSGDGQTGPVGSPLGAPLVVRVTDAFGNPIPSVPVNWSVTGGGDVSAASTQTDAAGLTSVQRTLGSTAGQQTTLAMADGLAGSPVTFIHTATAGNAARVTIISGDGQQAPPGSRLPSPLMVQVLDAENNPIVGIAVAWVVQTGDGNAAPETSQTDDQGRASTEWTLGPLPGRNTLSAVVSGVGTAAFTATASKVSSNTRITSHQPDPSIPGQAVEVRVEVTGSGATPTGTVSVTAEGGTSCDITLSNGSGACSLTFNTAGNQRITATYTGDSRFNGSSDDENHRVEAENAPPTAAFTPPSCIANQPCQFTDGSSDSDGNVVAWTWEFGDGGTANDRNPAHTYATAGTYNVKLTVRDDDGATNTVTNSVTVNGPPTAAFTNAACSAGVPCQFTDASTDDGSIVAWNWDFGDFSPPSNEQNPTHIYIVGAGFTYQVALTVTDNQGLTSSVTQGVTVQ
jgi:PKD repeat protein